MFGVYLALRSMYGVGSRGLSSPRLDFMNISLMTLGICSFLNHASLRQTLEFADEISMFGLNWSMLQATLTARQAPAAARLISTGLAVVFVSFSIFYVWSANLLYQGLAFAGGIGCVILRSQYLFHWPRLGFPKTKSQDWKKRTWQAITLCLVGYGLWNVDLVYCQELRAIRSRVGLPWAWLFELHGWWYILTALGASQFMNVAREVQEEVKGEKKE